MDKLQMAHDFSMKLVGNPTTPLKDMDSIIAASWRYADAMQAEADKREDKTRPEVLEEWQPDWSQAPGRMNWFSIDKDGTAAWHINKPEISATEWVADCGDCGGDCYMYTSNFGYTGNWKDSLRKRPQ